MQRRWGNQLRLPGLLRNNHLSRTPREASVFVIWSAVLAFAGLFAVAWLAGFVHVENQIAKLDPVWFAVAFGAQVLAYLGYMLAYREIARVDEGPELDPRHTAAIVSAGFGAFVARGGFAVDMHAFRDAGVSDREARVRVFGLSALEYAILGPAACAAAIAVLVDGKAQPSLGLTLPWAVAVPVGFAAALWAVAHRERLGGSRGWRDLLAQALESIYVLRCVFTRKSHLVGPIGSTLYWLGEVVCLWACLQAFTHGTPDVALLLLGYATGYALTRRSLPFAGAGAVETLLPFALSWCGISLAAAVMAVFAYRVFNLWLPLLPAAFGLRTLQTRRATYAA
jgi:uncharacterized membrane protein YbhN (UPF0104 family)